MGNVHDIKLVELAELYLYYYPSDYAFTHVMGDPRARVISPADVRIKWKAGEVDWKTAWDVKGVGLFNLASMHYWRNGIDFDYVDIGANIGITAIAQGVFYKRCGMNNKVYAFEPGDVFPLLRATTVINQIDDITVCVRAAVSDQAGRVEFHLAPAQSPASSLLRAAVSRPEIGTTRSILVDAVTFDGFTEQLRPAPGLLANIDTEGADFKVIDGMHHTLANRMCTIQIEWYQDVADTYCDSVDRLRELTEYFEMIDVGTKPYRIIGPGADGFAAFVEKVREQPRPVTDIFMVPRTLPAADVLIARVIAE
jgi:FkbM family methyltransferase